MGRLSSFSRKEMATKFFLKKLSVPMAFIGFGSGKHFSVSGLLGDPGAKPHETRRIFDNLQKIS